MFTAGDDIRVDDSRLAREQRFHDALAEELDPGLMPLTPLSDLDRAALELTGAGQGLRILDLGCGSGDLTLHLVAAGADVYALDLSGRMVDVTRRRVELHGRGKKASYVVAPAERTGLDDGMFDVVIGRFILHHLDVAQAAPEIARILKPGGRAVFAENSARNAILMAARRHLAGRFGIPRLGTADERPLSADDLQALARPFSSVSLSYPVFEFLTIFDRQVFRYRLPRVSRVLRAADRATGRSRRLAPYSFRVVVTLER